MVFKGIPKILYICPKYLNENTPKAYQEWMRAIEDSLDEQVEESDYTVPEVRQIFDHIGKDLISPEERASMFDEYGEEQVKQQKFEEGMQKAIKETAKAMLKEGLDIALISKITQLPEEEITRLYPIK